ncbi:putative integral membrane protein [Theileria parva strain Muguga]|uniref:Uncharacterized protein n=1 Tax=Theileria parva TaxID=5875 RepID=Q4N210_THEPA|nr:putative integral membrane protein [Theileria parva strain Muguga]EAN31919.1 putative integral membrane protein [Theileria parva strain Muguga]|eukprot:XP_764202.1 hypothetical protein [Theileria parva strain Muguga]
MWKKLGYIFCLSSGFNFVLFQALFVHLKFGKLNVELEPERVPTASKACMAVGIIHLLVVILTILYIKGVVKFNPVHYFMRVLNMAGRHGPATGQNRYRRFNEAHFESDFPASPNLSDTTTPLLHTSTVFDTSNSGVFGNGTVLENGTAGGSVSRRVDSQAKIPIPPYVSVSRTQSSSTVLNHPESTPANSMSVNRTTDTESIQKKPSIELIDLN